ncbi:MAG TPA: hypothetical protein VEV84_05650 [Pyrinomonadaceae bacterium]|nr:hypothetical protein [Pyrinomonadaceae bacterium]
MKGLVLFGVLLLFILGLSGCGAPTGNANLSAINTNSGVANSISNSNLNAVSTSGATVDTREPEQYQATVKLSFQTLGNNAQQSALPPLGANVARSGNDRVMEFNLPTNEKVIFLDKGGMNYLILPNRKQYAELTKEALGFEVRRLMMPAEIVQQAKAVPGMKLVGEEVQNGRQVVRYAYEAQANTNTAAGTVATESYMIIDKETGLPLRTETVSQSQSGGNVNGVNGVRIVTEMTDIKDTPDASLFNLPTDYQKIDPETVKANVNMIFQAISSIAAQMMQQNAPVSNANANTRATPTMTP